MDINRDKADTIEGGVSSTASIFEREIPLRTRKDVLLCTGKVCIRLTYTFNSRCIECLLSEVINSTPM